MTERVGHKNIRLVVERGSSVSTFWREIQLQLDQSYVAQHLYILGIVSLPDI